MPDVVGLKVKVLRNADGTAKHPPFKQTLAVFQNPDYAAPEIYYDQTSDCQTDSPHSPVGERWALKLVDKVFAQQALAAFPTLVSVMTEPEIQAFWDQRVQAKRAAERRDVNLLAAYSAELSLRKELGQTTEVDALKVKLAKALDPTDTEPGIREDPLKTWTQAKAVRAWNVVNIP